MERLEMENDVLSGSRPFSNSLPKAGRSNRVLLLCETQAFFKGCVPIVCQALPGLWDAIILAT